MKHFLTKVFCTGLMLKSRDSFSVKLVATLIFSNCVGLWDGSQIELEYIPGRDINCCCMGERINMDSTSWWSVITSIKFSTFIQPCMMAACHDQKVNKVTWVSLHFETMTIVSWNTAVALPIAWVLKWRVSALCIPTYSAIAWCAYLSLLFFVPFYSLLLLGIIAHIPYCTEEFFSDRQDLLADSGYAANSYTLPSFKCVGGRGARNNAWHPPISTSMIVWRKYKWKLSILLVTGKHASKASSPCQHR